MKYLLALTYQVHMGALAPHGEALRQGRALASRCTDCGHVAFPPRAVCAACGARDQTRQELTGQARIIATTTSDGNAFALVRLVGSDTCSIARLAGDVTHAAGARLIPSQTDMPGLWVGPAEDDA